MPDQRRQDPGCNKAPLYYAGTTFFPNAATITAQTDNRTYARGPAIQAEADWAGSPAALAVVMALCDQLQRVSRHTGASPERIGENLVTLANDSRRPTRAWPRRTARD